MTPESGTKAVTASADATEGHLSVNSSKKRYLHELQLPCVSGIVGQCMCHAVPSLAPPQLADMLSTCSYSAVDSVYWFGLGPRRRSSLAKTTRAGT